MIPAQEANGDAMAQAFVMTGPWVGDRRNGLIHSWAGPGSTGTPRCLRTAAGSKRNIGSVTGDMLAGSVFIHWLARAKAAMTVSGYIAKARPSPRAAARRRIHSAWALPVFAASDMVCSRRILDARRPVGVNRQPRLSSCALSLTRAGVNGRNERDTTGEGAHDGRGVAHRHQHREAAGVARQGGSRLNSGQPGHDLSAGRPARSRHCVATLLRPPPEMGMLLLIIVAIGFHCPLNENPDLIARNDRFCEPR
jgi:hypothetical protein